MDLTPETDSTDLIRAAEAAAGVPTDAEFYAEYLPNGDTAPPAAETPAEAEPATEAETEAEPEAEPEPAEPATEPPLLAGKYKTTEALEAAYLEAQRAIGAQGNEVGQLRAQMAEVQNYLNQPAPPTQDTVNWFDEMAATDPQQAVDWAVRNNDPMLYQRGLETWHEIDSVSASRFERAVERQQMAAQLEARFAPRIQAGVQVAQQQQLAQALGSVQSKHEDFGQVMGALSPDDVGQLLGTNPVARDIVVSALQSGSVQETEAAYETLYAFAKAQQAGTLTSLAAEAADQAAAQNRADKMAGTVASATVTAPPDIPETEEARLMRVWKDDSPPTSEFWTGQDSRRR